MISGRMSIRWLPVIFAVAILCGVAVGIPVYHHERNQCEARGGHLGPKSLCLTPDGKVIE